MADTLRKHKADGTLYCRPPAIETLIEILSTIPREELVRRAHIFDREDPDYIPSECLVYFLRHARFDSNDKSFQDLFILLRQRVLRALPAIESYALGGQKQAVSASLSELREAVLFRFNEMLCIDRSEYDERLDYFEIRFDGAVASLRRTARKKTAKEESRQEPLTYENATNDPSKDVEEALARLSKPVSREIEEADYRFYLQTAIDLLPDNQRRVIEMLLQDIPIDSADDSVVTIVKTLDCSEKTVRNRRDRAYSALRVALREETVL